MREEKIMRKYIFYIICFVFTLCSPVMMADDWGYQPIHSYRYSSASTPTGFSSVSAMQTNEVYVNNAYSARMSASFNSTIHYNTQRFQDVEDNPFTSNMYEDEECGIAARRGVPGVPDKKTPIGDGIGVLLLLCAGFLIYTYCHRQKSAPVER